MKHIKINLDGVDDKPRTLSHHLGLLRDICDSQNASEGNLTELDCELCKNKGYILTVDNDYVTIETQECECMPHRRNKRHLEKEGLIHLFETYTFDLFEAKEEWQKKFKELAYAYSQDPQGWLFIGGQIGCVDCDTEYFDGTKWKKISDYQQGDKVLQYTPQGKHTEGKATLVTPLDYIKQPATHLWEIQSDRGSINQCLSLNHDFAYLSSKGNFNKKPFHEVIDTHNSTKQGFYGKVVTTFEYDGCGIDLTDEQIKLMVAVIADGTFPNKSNMCHIRVKKQRKKDRIQSILINSRVDYKVYDRGEYDIYAFQAPRKEKHFTEYWYGCNQKQMHIIADEVLHWDGYINGRRRTFSTSVKESADFIQFVFSATGHRATISEMDRIGDLHKSIEYSVIISRNKTVSLIRSQFQSEKTKIVLIPAKDGYQYCFTVPSGNLVLRRNKRIFVTGNSGKTLVGISVLNEFMNRGEDVRFVRWQDFMNKLKAVINDQEYFDILDHYTNVDVLYIDDLFKGGYENKPTDSDVRLTQIIIDTRYVQNKTTIISTELLVNDIMQISESIGSRIVEKSKGNIIQIEKLSGRNYRLR